VNASGLLYNISLSTNIADTLFINDANATSIATRDALREINFPFIQLHRTSTPTTIVALFQRLPPALGADDKG
jgi:3-dehydroquinate dehydratase